VGRRSLAAWTEADGNPEASQLIPFGGLLFVVLQRLDNYPGCSDAGRSALLALDAETLEPVGHFGGEATLTLAGCNAYAAALHADGRLMVALTGRYQWSGDRSNDGGVEVVDLTQGSSRGWLTREGEQGDGDITEVAAAGDGSTLWVASSADFTGSIFRADRDGNASGPLWSGSNLFDISAHGDALWVANRSSMSAAVVLLDGAGNELGRAVPPAPPIAFLPLEAATLCP
jgi:DNA-binding beta-propeller fold protein YncE